MPPEDNNVKIAVLEERLNAIRELQEAQASTTKEMFTKLLAEIDILKAAMNRGRGVFAASLTFAGFIGSAATACVGYFALRK